MFVRRFSEGHEVSTGSGSDRVSLRQFDRHPTQTRSLPLPVPTSCQNSDLIRSIVITWRGGGELADGHGEQGRYTMT